MLVLVMVFGVVRLFDLELSICIGLGSWSVSGLPSVHWRVPSRYTVPYDQVRTSRSTPTESSDLH